jgi:hypothetical protein
MGFLDNSGDIILDAVLTDTGRYRLAQGNGSFKITKFALGDDEINYGAYNKNHPSGSAYYDLEILQTPVMEAFTNNTSTMKTKLISIPRTNLLYLPVMQPNTGPNATKQSGSVYAVAVNEDTVGRKDSAGVLVLGDGKQPSNMIPGVLNGYQPNGFQAGNFIQVDQGLNTSEIPKTVPLDADLIETQYIVEMDNRFGSLVSSNPNAQGATAIPSFVDDDNIASYYFSLASDSPNWINSYAQQENNGSSLSGPDGTFIGFKIQASTELQNSSFLFEQLGSTGQMKIADESSMINIRFIDTTIKITGATTGASTDVAIRYVRKQ